MRKRFWVTGALVASLAVPATAFAAEPTKTDKTNAAKECRAERGDTDATREAFRAQYGTNKNGKNAFGRCVSQRAQDEQAERKAAKRGASRDCREERAEDVEAFREKHGTNKNKRNAFGKCVSTQAKKKMKAADRADRKEIKQTHSAAKECAEERDTMGDDAFGEKYGSNKNGKNAFGKCVSQTARS